MLDFSRCRILPYEHQKVGILALVQNAIFALFDEMGAGKTKQVIDAAQFLFELGVIDRVLIVAPAAVRSVWYDQMFGELAKHLWVGVFPSTIMEFHSNSRIWYFNSETKPKGRYLQWMVTNYDFIRMKVRLTQLLPFCTMKTLLVLDESSAVKNQKAQQSKACFQLRQKCGRVVLLNGTPIANHPGDMYSQGNIMDRKILDCSSYWAFRSRYAVMGGWQQKQIVKWRDVEDIQKRFAPYVLRRLKKDCLDLPEKLPSVVLSVALSDASWKIYKEMRDEMVAWLSDSTVSQAPQAITKVMRLAQVTSGFLGGIEEMVLQETPLPPDWDPAHYEPANEEPTLITKLQEIGREKLDGFLHRCAEWWEEDPHLKLLVFSRFRPEILRAVTELRQLLTSNAAVGTIIGGQKKAEREYALRLLDPRTAPDGPAVVVASTGAGGMGLNLTASHTVVYLSNDYSLKTRLQSEDRVHRPGQVNITSYFDFVATGPSGQKTIDHKVLAALMKKENLATMTTSAWIRALKEE
jgi:SNF2 family DNA or RNA helicase